MQRRSSRIDFSNVCRLRMPCAGTAFGVKLWVDCRADVPPKVSFWNSLVEGAMRPMHRLPEIPKTLLRLVLLSCIGVQIGDMVAWFVPMRILSHQSGNI